MNIYLGSNITHLREKNKFTKVQLANFLDRKNPTIVGWEKGDSYPQFQVLVKLKELFNVNLEDLVFRDLSVEPEEIQEAEKPPYFSIYEVVGKQQARLELQDKVIDDLHILLDEIIMLVKMDKDPVEVEKVTSKYEEKIRSLEKQLENMK